MSEEKRNPNLDTLARKAVIFQLLFNTPVGQQVLDFLSDEFDADDLVDQNSSYVTHYNLGRRDVVVYIRQMLRHADKVASANDVVVTPAKK